MQKIKDLEKELDEFYSAYGHAVMARSPSRDELQLKIDNINDELGKLKFSLNENDLGYIDIKPLLQKEPLAQVKKQIKQGLSEKYQFLDEKFTKGDESFQRLLNEVRKHIETRTNTTPLKEFGTNYAEFYRDGQGAVKKLLAEKQGQVAGAFYRQELGDIDLVWGNDEIGLKKIIDKHLSDFADFKGDTAQDKLANALGEIVKDGKLINEKGVNTLYFSQGEKVYLVGLSEGFNGVGNNKWIITSYKVENIKPHIKEQIGSANKTLSADESLKEPQAFGSTADTNEIIPKTANESQGKANSMLESKKAYDSELKRLNNELEYTETLLGKINERGMIDKLNDLRDEILAQKRELLKQDPFKFEKVSHKVSHINQNNAIMSEISHKGGQDGTSNASNGLNAAEKGMPASEPAGISDGLFSQKQLLDEPRGAGADLSNSPTHRQQPQTLFSQGASEPNASGGQQRGSNERLRTASGDLRGEVSGDGQNLRAEKGHNVSERFGQDRSEQHSRAKHTIRANSSSGASHSNATATQELVSDTNAAGILSPAEKATIENQTFTQTIDPAKFNANEILSANINALKVLDELLTTRNLATNEQKELLSAFSGAGGRFSDELNKIRKANPNDERLAYINGLLKQINDKLPKASGEIVDKGLSITDFYARSGDAYFTPTHIIKAMSDLAKKMGLKDESYILEPSAGVGRFLGFFDDKHPYIHAVELDKLSANIARKLYPTAQIENAPFQNSLAARNIGSYDLIIGNPPYANVKIQDKMIHDYFMLKSIENLKENGISIQIVTHNFMDKMSSAKMQIAKNAEFLGGVRLPNDTFKDAKVTTDILVFRKLRADEVGTADTSWTKLSDFENGLKVSSYFKEQKPQNVLGELITQKGQFGDSVGVKSTGFDLENLDLSKFIKESKEAFHTEKMHLASTQLAEPQKTGNFYKENGEIFQNGQKVDLKERLKEYGIDWADSTFEKRIAASKSMVIML